MNATTGLRLFPQFLVSLVIICRDSKEWPRRAVPDWDRSLKVLRTVNLLLHLASLSAVLSLGHQVLLMARLGSVKHKSLIILCASIVFYLHYLLILYLQIRKLKILQYVVVVAL